MGLQRTELAKVDAGTLSAVSGERLEGSAVHTAGRAVHVHHGTPRAWPRHYQPQHLLLGLQRESRCISNTISRIALRALTTTPDYAELQLLPCVFLVGQPRTPRDHKVRAKVFHFDVEVAFGGGIVGGQNKLRCDRFQLIQCR